MNKPEVAVAFSNGEFEKTKEFIADNANWTVVGENHFCGKEEIWKNCEIVAAYFKSVETDFKTLNVITEGNKVVVNGTAEFLRNKECISFVQACDVYEFNNQSKIEKITSYCIQTE